MSLRRSRLVRPTLAALLVLIVAGCSSAPSPSATPKPTIEGSRTAPTADPSRTHRPAGAGARVDATPAPGDSGPYHGPIGSLDPNATVTVVAAGDIACDPTADRGSPATCDQDGTAALIGQLAPTAVLALGDNAYEKGSLSAFQTSFAPTWGRYRSIMYPAIGNHEYLTSGAAGYFTYFGAIAPYYSYDLGRWHLVSLDSECSHVGGCEQGSPQETWLRADLAAHPTQCTLVYWHEPRWSSGEHGDAAQMATIWSDLVDAHVDVVLSGHNHDYERFQPLDGSGNPSAGGVTEFVVGTGGKNHYKFTVPPLTGEVVRDDTSFGVLQLTLAASSYSWSFMPAAGYAFQDSGTADCH